MLRPLNMFVTFLCCEFLFIIIRIINPGLVMSKGRKICSLAIRSTFCVLCKDEIRSVTHVIVSSQVSSFLFSWGVNIRSPFFSEIWVLGVTIFLRLSPWNAPLYLVYDFLETLCVFPREYHIPRVPCTNESRTMEWWRKPLGIITKQIATWCILLELCCTLSIVYGIFDMNDFSEMVFISVLRRLFVIIAYWLSSLCF